MGYEEASRGGIRGGEAGYEEARRDTRRRGGIRGGEAGYEEARRGTRG